MGAFSIWHIVVIAIVAAFLFFGWKQLPDMARSFGRSLRVFKTEIKGMTDDDKARDTAGDTDRSDHAATAEPKQLQSPPQAEVVRNPVARPTAGQTSAPRPRPGVDRNGTARR